MAKYEIYYVPPCSCDSEWLYLGKVEASTDTDALKQAVQLYEYPLEVLVALSFVVSVANVTAFATD